MSRIDKLIAELCPNGVEFKELGEVMNISRGASPRPIKNFITNDNDGVPWIKIGDVNSQSKYITKTKEKITIEGVSKSRYHKQGDFVLSNSMSFGRPYILAIDGCIHDGWISMQNFEDVLISDFLYYLLSSDVAQKYWIKKASSGTVKNLNADIVKSTIIPIPPLPIQQEIVRILDTFTDLDAELQAELEARKKQYEHYRDQLLNFEGKDVEWSTIKDLYDFKNGLNKGKEYFGKGTPIVNFTDVYNNLSLSATNLKGKVEVTSKEKSLYSAQKNDIFFTRTSETQEDIGMAAALIDDIKDCVFSGFILRARPKTNLLNPKFFSLYLSTFSVRNKIIRNSSFTTRALTSGPRLSKIKIPLPTLSEQECIVSILDKFNDLVKNELPAEIAARRKQYEYYREKLLTFNRAE